jgi:hypothetical protein
MTNAEQLANTLNACERSGIWYQSSAAANELRRLSAIEAAARNLVKVKGRYHTEQAYKALAELLANTYCERCEGWKARAALAAQGGV